MPVCATVRCKQPTRGVIRNPATRNTGSESISIDGLGRMSTSKSASRVGLSIASGGGGASRIATTSFGGSL